MKNADLNIVAEWMRVLRPFVSDQEYDSLCQIVLSKLAEEDKKGDEG